MNDNQKFAIIECKGLQYKVLEGNLIYTQKIDEEIGTEIEIEKILLFGDLSNTIIGHPYVENVSVSAKILKHVRNKKTIVFKKRKRQNSRKKNGHIQNLTVIQINKINQK